MEILQNFLFDNTTHEVTIVQTDNGPMFKASDIGRILGIKNMRDATSNFADDQRHSVVSTDAIGRNKETPFLTEKGVYRVLCQSRKPIAWPFQEWVIDVIDEINKKGFYELKSAKEEAEKYREQNRELLEKKERIEHETLMESFNHKYIVYYGRIREIDGKTLVKIGSTKNIKESVNRHLKDYGTFKLFFALECGTNEKFERFLQKHEIIEPYKYTLPCKVEEGKKSHEVFLLNEQEIEQAVDVCRRNAFKYNEAPPDVQTLNGVLNNLNETSEAILSNVTSMEERLRALEGSKKRIEPKSFQNGRQRNVNVGRGDKIQKYSPDGKQLIKTYSSIVETVRDPELGSTTSNSALKRAIENNSVYKRHRWAFLSRDKPDDTVQQLAQTQQDIVQVNIGFIAMLDLKRENIVKVFPDQKRAAEDRNFKSGASISKAVRKGTMSGGHYFKLWHECPEELREKYLEYNDLPDPIANSRTKAVIQIGFDGTERRFTTVKQVTKEFQVGRKSLFSAIEHEYILKGFRWKFEEN